MPVNHNRERIIKIRTLEAIRQKNKCLYCLSELKPAALPGKQSSKLAATVDHIVPKCNGGKCNYANLVVVCRGCNSRKGCKDPNFKDLFEGYLKLDIEPRIMYQNYPLPKNEEIKCLPSSIKTMQLLLSRLLNTQLMLCCRSLARIMRASEQQPSMN